VHIVAGICLLGWVLRRAVRGEFSGRYYTPVELAGLYWHLVDLIWIYLFPLLYLVS
jgi:cytochrome c oxidase subunit 3